MSQIPVGYKQTEVGVIPEEWETARLGQYVEINSGESPSRFKFTTEGFPYFKVEQLNNDNKYSKTTPYFFQEGKTVQANSLIFPKRGASILLNKIRLLAQPSFMDTNLMTLTVDETHLFAEYLFYYLDFKGLSQVADTTSIPQINNKHISPFLIPLPPKQEQEAIAEVLSDADALIEATRRLIEKKRLIKQGAMQHLLTPKDDWEVKKLGEIGEIITGSTPPTNIKEYWNGSIPWVTPTDIGSKKDMFSSERKITNLGLQVIRKIPENTLLVTCIASIGKNAILRKKGACNQQINAIIPYENNNVDFLYYLMEHNRQYLLGSAGITATLMISKKDFSEMGFAIPKLEEQTRIAAILSDMDEEIEALESKLSKQIQIKEAMMQNLLTGKVRLV